MKKFIAINLVLSLLCTLFVCFTSCEGDDGLNNPANKITVSETSDKNTVGTTKTPLLTTRATDGTTTRIIIETTVGTTAFENMTSASSVEINEDFLLLSSMLENTLSRDNYKINIYSSDYNEFYSYRYGKNLDGNCFFTLSINEIETSGYYIIDDWLYLCYGNGNFNKIHISDKQKNELFDNKMIGQPSIYEILFIFSYNDIALSSEIEIIHESNSYYYMQYTINNKTYGEINFIYHYNDGYISRILIALPDEYYEILFGYYDIDETIEVPKHDYTEISYEDIFE